MFSIKYAKHTDIPLIRELTFAVWPQTYAHLLSQEQIDYMLEWMYSYKSLKKQMDEGCHFIIIYNNQSATGFASYQQLKPGLFKLHKIYILTSEQGKGTGSFLIKYIIDDIKKQGATALQLQVNRSNPAQHFYTKEGFIIIGENDFDIGNGYFMNDYIMEKKI